MHAVAFQSWIHGSRCCYSGTGVLRRHADLFCAPSYVLYAATIGGGNGGELGRLWAFIIYSPLIGLFLVLSVSAGLVASHVVYRRSAHSSGA